MKKKYENRQLPCGDIQTRESNGVTQIVGYAARFNSIAHDEVIRPGAFTKTLKEQQDIQCYWNHDSSLPLGRQSNGTLTLRQDDNGLWMEVTPNMDTSWGRDAMAAVQRQDVRGMSFGFRITAGGMVREDDQDIYEIREVALREVSPCTDPWYEATDAQVRADDEEAADDTTLEAVPSADTSKADMERVREQLKSNHYERFSL